MSTSTDTLHPEEVSASAATLNKTSGSSTETEADSESGEGDVGSEEDQQGKGKGKEDPKSGEDSEIGTGKKVVGSQNTRKRDKKMDEKLENKEAVKLGGCWGSSC